MGRYRPDGTIAPHPVIKNADATASGYASGSGRLTAVLGFPLWRDTREGARLAVLLAHVMVRTGDTLAVKACFALAGARPPAPNGHEISQPK